MADQSICKTVSSRKVRRAKAPNGAHAAFLDQAVASDTDACIEWPYARLKAGYGQTAGGLAHRTVCRAAHGSPADETMHAAHKCGNPACCNPRHLYWATPSQNQADRITHGTSNRGTRQWQSQLDEDKVREIRRLSSGGMTHQKIADQFGVSRLTVTKAIRRYTWAWVE